MPFSFSNNKVIERFGFQRSRPIIRSNCYKKKFKAHFNTTLRSFLHRHLYVELWKVSLKLTMLMPILHWIILHQLLDGTFCSVIFMVYVSNILAFKAKRVRMRNLYFNSPRTCTLLRIFQPPQCYWLAPIHLRSSKLITLFLIV